MGTTIHRRCFGLARFSIQSIDRQLRKEKGRPELTQANSFKRKNGSSNEERKVVLVKECNVGSNAIISQAVDAEVPQVDDTKDDEQVGDHTGQREDRHSTDQDQRDQNHQCDQDVVSFLDPVIRTPRESLDDSVNVLGDKDQVRTAEANLRESHGYKHSQTHVFAKQNQSNVLEGFTDHKANFDQHQEGDTANNGDRCQQQRGEEDAYKLKEKKKDKLVSSVIKNA